uniref:Reverse transcriptase domain-containing protein n=1 Tax=Spongospora subterranea TaxID=70186 RepID=A0A0H5RDP2_9EUKA|eukprot:CRZ11876.1 hypothetical protein [Spongospora subterranea]
MEQTLDVLLHNCTLLWVDDILGYANNPVNWLVVLNKILDKLHYHYIKLSPDKCELLLSQVEWCGRVISSDGVTFDPDYVSTLNSLPPPSNGSELQNIDLWSELAQFPPRYPRFASLVDPLQQLLLAVWRSVDSLRLNTLQISRSL